MTSMRLLVLSVAVIVASNVLYHVSQKSIPAGVHPLLSVAVTYAAALLVTLALWPLSPGGAPKLSGLAQLNWATLGVAVSAVGIEIGFLLAYRAGWNINIGSHDRQRRSSRCCSSRRERSSSTSGCRRRTSPGSCCAWRGSCS